MTATERLDAIEARANAATDGPWKYIGRNWIDTPPITVDEADWGPEGHHGLKVHTAQEARAYRYADAEFIAAARQDVPDLIAALRAVLDVADEYDEDARLHRLDADRFYDPSEPRSHRLTAAREANEHATRIRTAVKSVLGGAQ